MSTLNRFALLLFAAVLAAVAVPDIGKVTSRGTGEVLKGRG
jgi:hypothetical protein